ncbi:MAG: hypothetical protein EOP35_01010 [Rubrivivax sp.]|nr:MAG: hypothetical protein EOP35_01010 [Rubrivivax sp.]
MTAILLKFWLLRFLQVFLSAGATLVLVEWLRHGLDGTAYASVAGWAGLSALLAASVSAWWAYKRQCRLVFKDRA